jgi:SEC-C motif domain protein
MAEPLPCPCGSDRPYSDCCQLYLRGTALPPTAEALMRSRYTAYHQGNGDYLIATHHPTQRYPGQRATILKTIATTTWLGLLVLATEAGQPADRRGGVEFIAYYADPEVGQIHERSRFVRQKDRWFYVDGDTLPRQWPQRGDPCWCGSGKKYKACHGR